ncbi:LPS assembly lipoprotein LptE [Candidatus Methylobacter favarea]|nr:LPS assembly lipoprotein LptE [Candidatus Methylobacter favarea]
MKKPIIFIVAILLGACGYHLRGALVLPEGMKNIYLQGGSAEFRDQFRIALKSASGNLVNSSAEAGMIINIVGEDMQRRALSLSSRGRSNEFELNYRLQYELVKGDNVKVLERQPVEVRREYFNDQQDIMAKDNEEAVIRSEMYQQAVQNIITRIQVVLQAKAK